VKVPYYINLNTSQYTYTELLQKKWTVSTLHKTQTIQNIETHDAWFCIENLEGLPLQPMIM
jgi:hypothetical protein